MKTFKILFLLVIIAFLISCNKENLIDQIVDSDEMPGEHMHEMEIDNNNDFYFITSEINTPVNYLSLSCSFPSTFYLSKRTSESGDFEILDDDFIMADEIVFDKTNKLWARNMKTIFLKDGKTYKKIIDLSDDEGLFQFMAVDNENNIWAGGYTHGLYKIDSELNIELLTSENSPLPKSSMTNIHVDKYNNIWIAMASQGVLKITKDNWIHYNSVNSNITTQRIWCLVADKDDNIWIGTGFSNSSVSLMRFDGQTWETMNPRNDKNEIIKGTVRKLFTDENRIYVVSVQANNMAFSSNELLTFDGISWNKIYDIPEDDGIAELKIDDFRQTVWIRTLNKGIFKLAK